MHIAVQKLCHQLILLEFGPIVKFLDTTVQMLKSCATFKGLWRRKKKRIDFT